MSKFNRVTDGKFVRVAQVAGIFQQPAQAPSNQLVGNHPQDFAAILNTAPVQGPVKPAIQGPVAPQKPANPYNMFIKAGVNQQTYVGSAQDNEKLRAELSRQLGVNMPTFYDAYTKMFGKWDNHPENRINNLNGVSRLQAEEVKKKAEQLAKDKAKNDESLKNNPFNSARPNSVFKPQNPPNYQNLYSPSDPFGAIKKPSSY